MKKLKQFIALVPLILKGILKKESETAGRPVSLKIRNGQVSIIAIEGGKIIDLEQKGTVSEYIRSFGVKGIPEIPIFPGIYYISRSGTVYEGNESGPGKEIDITGLINKRLEKTAETVDEEE